MTQGGGGVSAETISSTTQMGDATKKYSPSKNGGTPLKDLKYRFSLPRTKKSVLISYAFLFCFILFTFVLAFNPISPDYSSSSKILFTNIFDGITCTYQNARDAFSLPQKNLNPEFIDQLGFFTSNITIVESPQVENQSQNKNMQYKDGVLKPNVTKIKAQNQTQSKDLRPSPKEKNKTVNSSQEEHTGNNGDKRIAEKGMVTNLTSSLSKKQRKEPVSGADKKSKTEKMMEQLMICDFFDGEWVKDDSYPLYKPGSCSLIDEQFNCFLNGRPDQEFQQYKWKPKGCILPRFVIKI